MRRSDVSIDLDTAIAMTGRWTIAVCILGCSLLSAQSQPADAGLILQGGTHSR